MEIKPKILNSNKSSSVLLIKNSNSNINDLEKTKSEVMGKIGQQIEFCGIRNNNEVNKLILDENGNSMDELKIKCFKIFDNFAKFSKEECKFIISHQSLIKILRYVNIISQKLLKLSDVDMILKKVCKGTKLDKSQFLDFIVNIAKKLNPQNFLDCPQKTTFNVITTFFEPFVFYIEQQNCSIDDPNMNQNNQHLQQYIITFLSKFEIDSKLVSLVNSIYSTLREVYIAYFFYEVNGGKEEKTLQGSLKNYLDFNKDFGITPYLLNINQIVCYWNQVNNKDITNKNFFPIYDEKRELGKIFTISKFSLMIIHFGLMSFGKINQPNNLNYTDLEKLLFFLEKLENSIGFKNLERKTNKPHNAAITFIPSNNVIKNVSGYNNLLVSKQLSK